jgi:tetratricopeptide (TPR) repeat protein
MRKPDWTEEDIYLIAERGHSLHEQGRYREAAVIFQGLVAVDPQNHYCRESLAAAWLALGEPTRALEHLNVLLTRDPGDLSVRARRLEGSLMAGDFPAAVRDFEYLRHLLPKHQVRRLEISLEGSAKKATLAEDLR